MPVPAPSADGRAVITGASQNIGEALAIELARRGHNLIITARREEVLEALADRLREQYGVTVEVRAVDLADPAARAAVCEELATRTISILCANAGTATFGPVVGLDPAEERKQVQLNVLGVHDLVLAVLPGMVERRAGGILISGSAAGNSPIPNNATYAATKAFANTFSESLRGEVKSAGVHVTVLAPGPVRETLPDAHEQTLVERLIPDFLWISTEYTAKVSLDGLDRNKMRVVPGVTSKAMSAASGYAPRAIVSPIVGA
ncbi:short-chain dehydrogenase, partial [Mycobacterium sp. ITM-2017-0098]